MSNFIFSIAVVFGVGMVLVTAMDWAEDNNPVLSKTTISIAEHCPAGANGQGFCGERFVMVTDHQKELATR